RHHPDVNCRRPTVGCVPEFLAPSGGRQRPPLPLGSTNRCRSLGKRYIIPYITLSDSSTYSMPHDQGMKIEGRLWITSGESPLAGHGRIALLSHIAEYRSISGAAKAMGMSYKAAWDAVDAMNNLAGEPLVERSTGGKGGGGTRLTPRGERLVANFRLIEEEHQRFVEQLGRQAEGIADDYLLVRRMSMKSSARNQFFGSVTQVRRGAVNDEVELAVADGVKIVAVITHDSSEALGLAPGCEAFALIKSSSIILVADDEGARFSA